MKKFQIISLFSGAGGLDLGFKKAGFDIVYANEFDKQIWQTFEQNFPSVKLDKRDIKKVPSENIPNCTGIIGSPPCQSWSEAGSLRGIDDPRGKLFYEYLRVVRAKKPLFFVAENVSGILHNRNREAFYKIINALRDLNYNMQYKLINAKNYSVPQDRKRVFIVGFLGNICFSFPKEHQHKITLRNTIFDLKHTAKPYKKFEQDLLNNEYYKGSFSPIFMSRNRVRNWDEQSFTIQAGARHIPIHPQAPRMEHIAKNHYIFKKGYEHLYRRFTVRECARIQTFPNNFKFTYNDILSAYKMVGNAVPVNLAYEIAKQILKYLII